MLYTSTRDNSIRVSAAQAIAQGISEEGGLFVPVELPHFDIEKIASMASMNYIDRAKTVLKEYLTDFTEEELDYCVSGAYAAQKFSSPQIAPTVNVDGNKNILELWHGPTCAFKDMALQLLPYLMTVSAKKTADGKTIVILVATSGDTGKAALEGFKNVDNTKILVFYPVDGVSPMQKLQMTTQEGENVAVCAINGNFDDAQSAVKSIFTNNDIKKELAKKNMMFSSANSINWGRLVPQIVYYFSTYCDLINMNKIKAGDEINIVVPTGNFGNILAAFYAKNMGLPIHKLICASNENKVLYDFFTTGTYDRNREFVLTTSPSMDILISSNLERLIYRIAGNSAEKNASLMQSLKESGKYEITDDMKAQLSDFYGNYATEAEDAAMIKKLYEDTGYVIDTHTAVAASVYEKYRKETSDTTKTVIASTASPYKFTRSVMDAIDNKYDVMSDFELVDELSKLSKVKVPQAIEDIRTAPVLHDTICDVDKMCDNVKRILHI